MNELTCPLAQYENSSLLAAPIGTLDYLSTLRVVANLHESTARSCVVLVEPAGEHAVPESGMRQKDLGTLADL